MEAENAWRGARRREENPNRGGVGKASWFRGFWGRADNASFRISSLADFGGRGHRRVPKCVQGEREGRSVPVVHRIICLVVPDSGRSGAAWNRCGSGGGRSTECRSGTV